MRYAFQLLLLSGLLAGGCGEVDLLGDVSGGDGPGSGSRATFGFHLLPQLFQEQDFQGAARIGQWAVLNVPRQFWQGPEASKVRAAMAACKRYQLRCIVRLEDQDIVATAPQARRKATSEAWFQNTFAPYVRQVVRFGRGKVWGYQVLNEPWYPQWQVLGPAGSAITPTEYIDLLRRTRQAVRAEDPAARVLMAGLVSITGSDTAARARSLVQLGILQHSDLFNFHMYSEGKPSSQILDRIDGVAQLVGPHPTIITECNHLREHYDDYAKFTTLAAIWRANRTRFSNLVAQVAYVWRAPGGQGWQIQGTQLEQLLIGSYSSTGMPQGRLERATPQEVVGWAYDPDAGTQPIDVHVYLDSVHVATVRADRASTAAPQLYPSGGGSHGFRWVPPLLTSGPHRVDLFAINQPAGLNPPIGTALLNGP